MPNDEMPDETSAEIPADMVDELDLEALWQAEIDHEADKVAAQKLLLPVGSYTTIPPWTVEARQSKAGRPYARLHGPIAKTINGQEQRGYTNFSMSWVLADGVDFVTQEPTGKPDRMSQNWLAAKKAYERAYGTPATTIQDVIAYLIGFPFRVRLIQTSQGENMVVSIFAVANAPETA